MQIFIIIALVIAIIAVIFALQNMTVVTVSFFFWKAHSSLALVLLITLAVGVAISLIASLPGMIRSKLNESSQKKRLIALEGERDRYRQKAEAAEKEVKVLEEQLASYSAELEKHLPDETSQPPPA